MRRIYRYWPWLIATTLLAAMFVAVVVAVIGDAVRAPDSETVSRAVVMTWFGGIVVLLLLLPWRTRTIVGSDRVEHRGVLRTLRIPYGEITAVDLHHANLRWDLRIRCGDGVVHFVLPCPHVLRSVSHALYQPPRVLVAARHDIESRLPRPSSEPPSPKA